MQPTNDHNENEPQYFFDNPRNINRLLTVFYSLCGVLVALDFVIHRHTQTALEQLPAFYAVYGFIACVLLVLIATQLRRAVMRKEDYYDVDE